MRSGVFASRIRGLYAGGIITVDAPCKLSLLAEQRRCFRDIVDAAAAIQISPVSIIRSHLSQVSSRPSLELAVVDSASLTTPPPRSSLYDPRNLHTSPCSRPRRRSLTAAYSSFSPAPAVTVHHPCELHEAFDVRPHGPERGCCCSYVEVGVLVAGAWCMLPQA